MARTNSSLVSVAPFTMAMVAINVILYGVSALQSQSLMTMNTDVLAALGASQRERLWQGEWLRLIAPMFLHGGLLHIGMNMNFLWRAGPDSEMYFGTPNFGTIYLLSGATGICLSQIIGGHLSIGASGSLCGIMGAHLAVVILRVPVLSQAWRSSDVKAELFQIAILLGIGLLGVMNIDNWGHIGGLTMGLFLGVSFELWRNRKPIGRVGVFASLILFAALVCAARWTVFNPLYHAFKVAVARDEDHDANAAKVATAEARKWAATWTPVHFLGVMNVTETDAVLHAHDLGLWNTDVALDPYFMMGRVKAEYRKGDDSTSLKDLREQLRSYLESRAQ
jgi:membrane associated rhomboid family serine protease